MNEITEWLNDEQRDYIVGVALYAKYSKNKAMANNFSRGTARFWMSKLMYELKKFAGKSSETHQKREVVKTVVGASVASPSAIGIVIEQTILAAKKKISSLYSIIDKMHKELYDLGTSNAEDVVKKRKKLLDKRLPIILRAEKLYLLKEEWFAGNKSVINEIAKMLSAPLDEQPSITASEGKKSPGKKQTQSNVSSMSDAQLLRRKTQLSSSITKTKNMLDFQSIRKGEVKTPMPDGPKRKEFEEKLQALKSEFVDVTSEIENRKL